MKNKTGHPLKYLSQQNVMLKNQLKSLEAQMNKEAKLLKNAQSMRNNGITGGGSPQSVMSDLSSGLPANLRPGNLGDINKVVWPFWFTTTDAVVNPNQAVQGNITITQEAAFIWLSYTKAVFLEETGGPGQYQYIDPNQADGAGKSNGLSVLFRDSQSSRQFMNKPIDINQVGYAKFPTVLPTPQLLLPNSNIEFTYQNNTDDLVYRPFITLFGLRVRIEDAQNILSTITG
jgi:hypothetical protein